MTAPECADPRSCDLVSLSHQSWGIVLSRFLAILVRTSIGALNGGAYVVTRSGEVGRARDEQNGEIDVGRVSVDFLRLSGVARCGHWRERIRLLLGCPFRNGVIAYHSSRFWQGVIAPYQMSRISDRSQSASSAQKTAATIKITFLFAIKQSPIPGKYIALEKTRINPELAMKWLTIHFHRLPPTLLRDMSLAAYISSGGGE